RVTARRGTPAQRRETPAPPRRAFAGLTAGVSLASPFELATREAMRWMDLHHGLLHHNSPVARETLLDFFHDLARARGDFLVHDDGFRSRAHTYADVGRASRGFAARLHDAGLRKGDTVVFFCENRAEWIVAFWGCLLGGIIVVPIDYRASRDFLERVSRIVAAKLVLVGQDVTPVQETPGARVWRL